MIKTKIIVKPKDGSSSSGSVTEGSYGSGYADYAASAGRAKQSERSALATLAETAISAYRAKRADMASELDPDSETLQGYVLKEWLGKLLSVVDVDGTEQDINGTVGAGMQILPRLGFRSVDVASDGHISLGGMRMVYDEVRHAWRLDGSLYVTGGLSALGNSDVAGGGGGGLDAELLWSLLGNNGAEQISKSHLADALAGYATEDWVEGKGYLTNRDAYTKAEIDAKGWSSNKGTVTSVGLTMPTGFSVSGSPITEKGILAVGFASGYSLPTTAKQNQWDTVYNWYSGITGSDTDTIINKWGEIISFLDGIEDTATLSGIVNGINKSIANETTRAKSAEQTLTNGVAANTKSISDEVTRAKGAENTISSNLTAEIDRSTKKDNELSKSITDEVSRAKAAEQTLTSSISANTSAINVLKGYFTNGVAKSAVKLQTARKIWGNVFDGTQDVNGDLILPNGKKIVIGGASLSWDADNNAVKIDGSVYATGGLSALGNSDTTGGGGGGLMGSIVPYAKAIALTVQNEGEEIASAWSVKKLYDKIETIDVSGQLTAYLTKQEARTLYQPVGNYLTGITKAQVEGVLTGNITSHTHSQYLTSHQSLANYYNKSSVDSLLSGKSANSHTHSVKINGLTKTIAATGGAAVDLGTYLTSHQDISGKADRSELSKYLPLSGGDMTGHLTVRQYIFGYNYNHAGVNAPAFVFDKPGSYYTGIGANGETNTIYFSCATISNGEASWITSYKQKWKFNGTIYQEDNAVIHAGNIGSQSVNYASTAGSANSVAWGNISGKPTTLVGYGITDGIYHEQVGIEQENITWFEDYAKAHTHSIIYNTQGSEYAYLINMRNDYVYGNILKIGYADTYLRMLRRIGNKWQSNDWEKISAGYADSAGTLDGVSNGSLTANYFNCSRLDMDDTLDDIKDGVYAYYDGYNPTNAIGDNAGLLQLRGRFWDRVQLSFPGNSEGRIYYRQSYFDTDTTFKWYGWKPIAFISDIAWSNVSGRPTRLSDFTDDVVSGKYLSLSTGGTVQGGVIFNGVVSFGEYQDFNYGPCSCTRPNTDDYSCYSFVSSGVKPFGLGYDTSYRIILGQPINNGGKGWSKKWIQIGEDATIAENFIANNSIQCNGQGSFNSLQIGNITISYDAANKGLRIAGGGLYTDSYLSSLGVDTSTALSVKKWADSINLTEESDAELATAYSIGNLYRMINSNQESITQSVNQSVSALQGRCTSLEQRVSALEKKVNK